MNPSHSTKVKENVNILEEDLVEKDKDIFYHVLSFDSFELHQQVNHNFRDLVDDYHTWESDLGKFLVPQVYDFSDFVTWCTSNYISSKRTVISKDGFVLIELIPEAITEMLRWPLNPDNEPLNEVVMARCFRELIPEDRFSLLQTYL
jgi:hypothetical protein